MNRIYNLVFNRALGQVQAVSEIAHRGHCTAVRGGRGCRAAVMLSVLSLGLVNLPAWAQVAPNQLPTGGVSLGGIQSIVSDGAAGEMTIIQNGERAAITWDSFDLGEDATVTFDQSAGDIALNQIMDADPSQIFGSIEAPGTIFLLNQNGIVFGESAQIDVGGLVASTLSTDTTEFLAGDGNTLAFEQAGAPASVINRGSIVVTNGGRAILLGAHVLNDASGLISADAGKVELAAGERITLNMYGGDFSVSVRDALQSAVTDALAAVENRGRLDAHGGGIYLSAELADTILADAVNHDGTIDATGLGTQIDGEVVLSADGGAVHSTGDIVAGSLWMASPKGLLLGGNISTSEDQSYGGSITLIDDTKLSGGDAADIDFGLETDSETGVEAVTIDGGHALAISTGGSVRFTSGLGQKDALSSLSLEATSFEIPLLNISGDLSVTATDGGISQYGAFRVGGNATFRAGADDVVLTNAGNDFGGLVDIAGGAVEIVDANALTLGTVTAGQLETRSTGRLDLGSTKVSGTLVANSNDGAIEQGGALEVAGTSNIDAGTGDVALTNADNDFGGVVDVVGGAISLRDVNHLRVASLVQGADRAVTLVAGGALDLRGGSIDTGTADLTLQSGAELLANVDLSGKNVTLQGGDGVTLGSEVRAAGNLSLTSKDASIAQVGGLLAVGGNTNVDAGMGDVTLIYADNDFGGAVNLTGGEVTITDSNALTLGRLETGNLVASSRGALTLGAGTVDGTLVAISNGGAIEQGGALEVAEASNIDAGTGDVTLANADNDFGGVVFVAGGAISLRDANFLAVKLAPGIDKTVTLVAGGDLKLDERMTSLDTGSADLTLRSGALLLTNVALGGANVTLQGDDGIALGADVTASGSLALLSEDAYITQGRGVLTAGGSVNVDAGTGDVILTNAGNDFGGAVDVTGNTVEITDANALTLGTVTAGQLIATSGGILDIAGSVIGGSNAALASIEGDIRIGGTVSAQNVYLDAGGAITEREGGSIIAGTLSGRANGPTTLGDADHHFDNQIDMLGNFSSHSGFSLTNGRTLTLASVDGSEFAVDAGVADMYLSVVGGDLLQQDAAWLYNGGGTFASTGRIGLASAPIHILGIDAQYVGVTGNPPAYLYAVAADGTLLPVMGGLTVNVPASLGASRAQKSNRTVAYVDVGADASNYRAYGIVDPGIRLPDDQRPECDPDFPSPECIDAQ